MDENSIQLLREDLTDEFQALAKSHTVKIDQLLEDFNDDQMLFRLEAKAYEEEHLATTANWASMPDEQESEPSTTNTTEAQQEWSAPANTNPTPDQQPVNTTLPKPVQTEDTQREAAATLHSAENPPSPTLPPPPVPGMTNVVTSEGPPSNQPEQPHSPEDILDILEED